MAPSEQRARRLGTSPSPLGCRTQRRGTALMQTQARDARKEAALCVCTHLVREPQSRFKLG